MKRSAKTNWDSFLTLAFKDGGIKLTEFKNSMI